MRGQQPESGFIFASFHQQGGADVDLMFSFLAPFQVKEGNKQGLWWGVSCLFTFPRAGKFSVFPLHMWVLLGIATFCK